MSLTINPPEKIVPTNTVGTNSTVKLITTPLEEMQVSPTNISDLNRMAVTPRYLSNEDTDYGKSVFDEGAYLEDLADLEGYRSMNQGALNKTGAAALRFIPGTIAKLGAGLGYVGGAAYAAIHEDGEFSDIYDNAVVNIFNDMDEGVKELFPIYTSAAYRDGDILDKMSTAEFWTNDVADGFQYLVSAAIPGIGISKGFQAAGMTGKALQAATLMSTATYNTISEAGAETNEFAKTNVAEMQALKGADGQRLYTDDYINQVVGEQAKDVFAWNSIVLAPSNLLQAKMLFGGFSDDVVKNVGKGIAGNAPRYLSGMAKESALGIAVEGPFEENIQLAIQNANAKDLTGRQESPLNIASEFFNNFTTTEGQHAIVVGSIIGGVMGGVSGYKDVKKAKKDINDYKDLVLENLKTLETKQKGLADLAKKVADGTVQQDVYDAAQKELFTFALGDVLKTRNAVTTGMGSFLTERYKQIRDLSPQEAFDAGLLTTQPTDAQIKAYEANPSKPIFDYQVKADATIREINDLTSIYERARNSVTTDQMQVGLQNDLFNMGIQEYAAKNRLDADTKTYDENITNRTVKGSRIENEAYLDEVNKVKAARLRKLKADVESNTPQKNTGILVVSEELKKKAIDLIDEQLEQLEVNKDIPSNITLSDKEINSIETYVASDFNYKIARLENKLINTSDAKREIAQYKTELFDAVKKAKENTENKAKIEDLKEKNKRFENLKNIALVKFHERGIKDSIDRAKIEEERKIREAKAAQAKKEAEANKKPNKLKETFNTIKDKVTGKKDEPVVPPTPPVTPPPTTSTTSPSQSVVNQPQEEVTVPKIKVGSQEAEAIKESAKARVFKAVNEGLQSDEKFASAVVLGPKNMKKFGDKDESGKFKASIENTNIVMDYVDNAIKDADENLKDTELTEQQYAEEIEKVIATELAPILMQRLGNTKTIEKIKATLGEQGIAELKLEKLLSEEETNAYINYVTTLAKLKASGMTEEEAIAQAKAEAPYVLEETITKIVSLARISPLSDAAKLIEGEAKNIVADMQKSNEIENKVNEEKSNFSLATNSSEDAKPTTRSYEPKELDMDMLSRVTSLMSKAKKHLKDSGRLPKDSVEIFNAISQTVRLALNDNPNLFIPMFRYMKAAMGAVLDAEHEVSAGIVRMSEWNERELRVEFNIAGVKVLKAEDEYFKDSAITIVDRLALESVNDATKAGNKQVNPAGSIAYATEDTVDSIIEIDGTKTLIVNYVNTPTTGKLIESSKVKAGDSIVLSVDVNYDGKVYDYKVDDSTGLDTSIKRTSKDMWFEDGKLFIGDRNDRSNAKSYDKNTDEYLSLVPIKIVHTNSKEVIGYVHDTNFVKQINRNLARERRMNKKDEYEAILAAEEQEQELRKLRKKVLTDGELNTNIVSKSSGYLNMDTKRVNRPIKTRLANFLKGKSLKDMIFVKELEGSKVFVGKGKTKKQLKHTEKLKAATVVLAVPDSKGEDFPLIVQNSKLSDLGYDKLIYDMILDLITQEDSVIQENHKMSRKEIADFINAVMFSKAIKPEVVKNSTATKTPYFFMNKEGNKIAFGMSGKGVTALDLNDENVTDADLAYLAEVLKFSYVNVNMSLLDKNLKMPLPQSLNGELKKDSNGSISFKTDTVSYEDFLSEVLLTNVVEKKITTSSGIEYSLFNQSVVQMNLDAIKDDNNVLNAEVEQFTIEVRGVRQTYNLINGVLRNVKGGRAIGANSSIVRQIEKERGRKLELAIIGEMNKSDKIDIKPLIETTPKVEQNLASVQKYTVNKGNKDLPFAPIIPIEVIKGDTYNDQLDLEPYGEIKKIYLVEIRGKNNKGQLVGTIRVIGKEGADNFEVVFNEKELQSYQEKQESSGELQSKVIETATQLAEKLKTSSVETSVEDANLPLDFNFGDESPYSIATTSDKEAYTTQDKPYDQKALIADYRTYILEGLSPEQQEDIVKYFLVVSKDLLLEAEREGIPVNVTKMKDAILRKLIDKKNKLIAEYNKLESDNKDNKSIDDKTKRTLNALTVVKGYEGRLAKLKQAEALKLSAEEVSKLEKEIETYKDNYNKARRILFFPYQTIIEGENLSMLIKEMLKLLDTIGYDIKYKKDRDKKENKPEVTDPNSEPSTEPEDDMDILEMDAILPENWDDSFAFQRNSKDTAGAALKLLFSTTPEFEFEFDKNGVPIREANDFKFDLVEDGEVITMEVPRYKVKPKINILGEDKIGDFNILYRELHQTLANAGHDFERFIALMYLSEKPSLIGLANKLQGLGQKVQNQFVSDMAKEYVNFISINHDVTRDEIDNEYGETEYEDIYRITVFNSNRYSQESNLVEEWISRQFYKSELIESVKGGVYKLNIDKYKELMKDYPQMIAKEREIFELYQELRHKGANKILVEDKVKKLMSDGSPTIEKYLLTLGIVLNQNTLDQLRRGNTQHIMYTPSGERLEYNYQAMLGDPSLKNEPSAHAPIYTLFKHLSSSVQEIEEWNKNNTTNREFEWSLINPLKYETNAVSNLAKIDSMYRKDLASNSLVRGDGKTVYNYTDYTHLSHTVHKLKKSKKFIQKMMQAPFSAHSFLGNLLLDNEQFRDTFDIVYEDSLKKKKGKVKGKMRKARTPKEIEVYLLNAFFNQNKNTRYVPTMTISDKTRNPLFKVQKIDWKYGIGKNGKLFVAKDSMQAFYNVALDELSRIITHYIAMETDEKYPSRIDKKRYKDGGNMFYIYPELNAKLAEVGLDKVSKPGEAQKFIDSVKPLIDEHMQTLINNRIAKWVEMGIVNVENKNVIYKYIDSKTLATLPNDVSHVQKARLLAMEYELTSFIMNVGDMQLISGDPAQFFKKGKGGTTESNVLATADEFIKRMAKNAAPGKQNNYVFKTKYDKSQLKEMGLNTDQSEVTEDFSEYLQVFVNDVKTNRSADKNSLGSSYKDVEGADAQEWITFKERVARLHSDGKMGDGVYRTLMAKIKAVEYKNKVAYDKWLKNPQGSIFDFVMSMSDVVLNEDEAKIMLGTEKPVYVGHEYDKDSLSNKVTYIKTSAFALTHAENSGKDIDKLRKTLEFIEMLNGTTVRASTVTGTKNGAVGVLNLFKVHEKAGIATVDEKGLMQLLDSVTGKSKVELTTKLKRENLRIQMEIPYDPSKNTITVVSQMNKLLFEGLLSGLEDYGDFILPQNKVVKDAKALKEFKEDSRIKLFDLARKELYSRLGLTRNGKFKDLKQLQERLLEEVESKGYSQEEAKRLKLDINAIFEMPLFFNDSLDKFQGIMQSMVSKVVLQKMKGKSFVQASSYGYITDLERQDKDQTIYVPGYSLDEGLKYARKVEDGKVIEYAQVLIPFKHWSGNDELLDIKKFITKNEAGKYILDTTKIDPSLLKILAARIPHQGHSSALVMEVVGFLPKNAADRIMVPEEITKQMGSDFDVDKIYTYMYNTEMVKVIIDGKEVEILQKIQYILNDDGTLSDKNNKEQLQNAYLDAHFAVFNNPKVFEKMVKILDLPDIGELGNKIQAAKRKNAIVSPFSLQYQQDAYIANRSGKQGVAIESNASTFLAVIQDKGIGLRFDPRSEAKYLEIDGKQFTGLGVGRYTNASGVARTNFDIIQMIQNASVDNAKDPILSKLNLNQSTFNLANQLAYFITKNKESLSLEFIAGVLNQDASVVYATKLQEINDSTTEDFSADKKYKIFEKLVEDLLAKDKTDRKAFENKETGKLSAAKLYNAYSSYVTQAKTLNNIENRTNEDIKIQLGSLALLEMISGMSGSLSRMQTALNIDSKGAGKDTLSSILKEQAIVADVINNEFFTNTQSILGRYISQEEYAKSLEEGKTIKYDLKLSDSFGNEEYFLMTTELGHAVKNSVILANRLWGQNVKGVPLLPHNTKAFRDMAQMSKMIAGRDLRDDEIRTMYKHLKSYIFSTNGFYDLNAKQLRANRLFEDKSIKEWREILFFGQESEKSLGERILEIKQQGKDIDNVFLKLLKVSREELVVGNDTKYLDLITMGAVNDNVDDTRMRVGFYQLLLDPKTEGIARDLVRYAYLKNGYSEPSSFIKYIPHEYLKSLGLPELLKSITWNSDGINIPHFMVQFFQHNPEMLPNANEKNDLHVFGDFVMFKDVKEDNLPTMFRTRNLKEGTYNVYIQQRSGTNSYKRIPELGGSYNFNEYDANTYIAKSIWNDMEVDSALINLPMVNEGIQIKEDDMTNQETFEKDQKANSTYETRLFKMLFKNSKNNALTGYSKYDIIEMMKSIDFGSKFRPLAELLLAVKDKLPDNIKLLQGDGKYRGTYRGSNVLINPKYLYGTMDNLTEELEQVILHELLHVYIEDLYSNYKSGINQMENLFLKNIEKLHAYTLENLTPEDKARLEVIRKYESEVRENIRNGTPITITGITNDDVTRLYPLINMEEFIVNGLTEPAFMNVLNNIKYDKDMSIFQKFLQWVSKIVQATAERFGIKLNAESVLNELMNSSIMMIDGMKNYGKKEMGLKFGYKLNDYGVKNIGEFLDKFLTTKIDTNLEAMQKEILVVDEEDSTEFVVQEYTPDNITELKNNEIFVFGSNAEGVHGKGAALLAKQKFGAIQGKSKGLQGQSYAVITKKNWRVEKSSTLDEIYTELIGLNDYAKVHDEKKFLVTKLGSSLAGYSIEEIKQLFKDLHENYVIADNIVLPKEYEVRNETTTLPTTRTQETTDLSKLPNKLSEVYKALGEVRIAVPVSFIEANQSTDMRANIQAVQNILELKITENTHKELQKRFGVSDKAAKEFEDLYQRSLTRDKMEMKASSSKTPIENKIEFVRFEQELKTDLVNWFSKNVKSIPVNIESTTRNLEQSNEMQKGEVTISINPQSLKNYTNYSGGAIGGDTEWANIGKQFGLGKQVDYRPETLSKLTKPQQEEVEKAYQKAVKDLGRKPLDANTFAGGLVRRDYLQAKAADGIFAISTIVQPGEKDPKGYVNKTSKPIVAGGTGYAVQMAINLGKEVNVFDQNANKWFKAVYTSDLLGGLVFSTFKEIETPTLTRKFAGIGTREINENGKRAIKDVYEATDREVAIPTNNTIIKDYSIGKVKKDYTITTSEGTEIVKGYPVIINDFVELDAFIFKNENNRWTVSEVSTGKRFGGFGEKSMKDTLESTVNVLNDFIERKGRQFLLDTIKGDKPKVDEDMPFSLALLDKISYINDDEVKERIKYCK